jgi:rod shape-determining protein MreD
MKIHNKQPLAFIINAVILVLLYVLRYSELMTLTIGQASPITLIPFVVAIAIFYGEWFGAAAGFFAGALMDGSMSGSSCFNTIVIMLIGLITGLLASYYMNKNVRSAACLSLGSAFVYLFIKTIFFYSFKEIPTGAEYYSMYFIPTVFYTALFIIPFYFLERKLREI